MADMTTDHDKGQGTRQLETTSPASKTRCCEVPNCVNYATHGGRCSVHVDLARESFTVHCHKCSRAIRAGTWHRVTVTSRECFPKCKPAQK
jgi:hypothetical protein